MALAAGAWCVLAAWLQRYEQEAPGPAQWTGAPLKALLDSEGVQIRDLRLYDEPPGKLAQVEWDRADGTGVTVDVQYTLELSSTTGQLPEEAIGRALIRRVDVHTLKVR
jgi:hypothetical protein